MKRIFTILFWLSVAVNVVGQQYAVVDGIYYGYAGDTAFLARRDNTIAGTNYSGDISIPSQVTINEKNYTVTSMEWRAFTGATITSVTLPGTIIQIPEEGFYNCVNLTALVLSDGTKTIKYNALVGCGENVAITISSSVTSISILKCISKIIVSPDNPLYDSRDNCNAVIETATNTIVVGCKNTVIPNTVTSIGNSAFGGCSGLTSITIPASVTYIDGNPFVNCTALTSIKVESGNSIYDSRNNCNAIIETSSNTLVVGCKNTIIPNSVEEIGESAFESCSQLLSISIPAGVTSINKSAFQGCTALTSVTIPDNVTNIGTSAFKNCTNLISITIPENVLTIGTEAFSRCSKLTSVTIPNSVISIGANAFEECSSITSVYIPASVNTLGDIQAGHTNPFRYCSALSSIKVAEDNPVYDSRNNCNAIIEKETDKLIVGCMNTIIPNSVTGIKASAFCGCKGLTTINIPNSVTGMAYGAFYNCNNLVSISLPNKLKIIPEGCFAFSTSLKKIYISESVKTIYLNAFQGSTKLQQVVCVAQTPPSFNTDFFPAFSATLYVLCDSYEAYKNHEYWGRFENIECRSLNALDMEDIAINDGEALPTIDLSEYFSSDDGEIKFSVKSSDNRVVYPVVMGNKLGFIQYGTGSAEITVTATVEPLSRSRSFTLSINAETPPQECELMLSAKITQPKCYGSEDGKIAVSVSGGTEPYYYRWNNGRTDGTLSGVSAGTYSVLVADENGCTAEKSFTIAETDSIAITEKLTKPTCRKSNGKITLNITGGTEPYTYLWNLPKNRIDVAKDLENLQSESYIITVTDKNSCKASKTINLPDNGAPTVKLKSVEPSKCLEATGSIEVEVSGGSTYSWSDSANVNKLIRPKLFPGNYTFKVSDNNGCRATMLVTVPMQQFRQPEISLVSYGDTAGHNLVIWQKEQTDEIEKYFVFRESNQAGDYDRIGSLAYNETSIYVDETANFNATSCRYRISAANKCGESQLSYAYRTMRLQRKRVDGGLLLWWNSYEGFEFVKYTLYRLTNEGLEKYAELPANKYRYVVKDLEPNTIGFFVTVELTEIVDVNKPMKAEGGPFAIAFSNLAEVENADAIEEVEENHAVVYSKDKKIFIANAQNKNMFVCDVTGKIVAQRKNVETAEIPVKTTGVYVVIVGKNVFKVIVE